MKKTKKFLWLIGIIPIISLPVISSSCDISEKDFQEKDVPLLTDGQIQTIIDAFEFKLTAEGKKLMQENKLLEKWDKFVRMRENKQEIAEQIINYNIEFKKYFIFKYHPLTGFGSAHKYNFKLGYNDNNKIVIKYQILCIDRNDQIEKASEVKLDLN
ncbi:variable surface lipoprotein [Metamycoplasma phocicerebrale]|uniref:Variable surface lipoprotein n=1 Tax=Metamycoplasma phocicerebrale TaxID=142649 RepID=A0A3T0TUT9_9BACT|nr:variable surface lipoprotein [Metamycoplasma phocicerebrale]AZZ65756.1 variable surface lipoprotein [Metamycoplasma phocicerebrale]